jgi:hypothetical protein
VLSEEIQIFLVDPLSYNVAEVKPWRGIWAEQEKIAPFDMKCLYKWFEYLFP